MDLNEDHIRIAVYGYLGLTSEDNLINEYNEFNTDSVGSHNGEDDTHMDGQYEETYAYNRESDKVYSYERILAGPMRDQFFKFSESEAQLQAAFTRRMFEIFQCELKRLFHCDLSLVYNKPFVDRVEKYDITDASIKNDLYGNQFVFRVKHTLYSEHFECNCKSFESKWIVCFILKVMAYKKTKLFNERYFLIRWRKGVVRHRLKKFFLRGYLHMMDEYKKYKELMTNFNEACNISLDNYIRVQFASSRLLDFLNDLSNFDHDMIQEVTQNGLTLSGNNGNDHIPNPTPNLVPNGGNYHISNPILNGPSPNFFDPGVHHSRGRPKEIRYKPPIEVLYSSFE
ncbi:hypothetical protein RND71_009652 [Anisodus tanguticus]|uniref:Protein FAR1-RELATED SEQUENCE n=1 Tax=Anisodus tanguticus TaxID=243964 RepID=A0AAE1VID7_9SOLA|nr:hypothetical protein RND71_009652 [Anisodus tanguticus]